MVSKTACNLSPAQHRVCARSAISCYVMCISFAAAGMSTSILFQCCLLVCLHVLKRKQAGQGRAGQGRAGQRRAGQGK